MRGQQIAQLSLPVLKIFHSLLFVCLFFLPPRSSRLEEVKDVVESSEEPDSILPDSIQSKGKGVGEALRLSRTSLFISRFLLAATAAGLKFTAPGESSALCTRVLPRFTLLVSTSPLWRSSHCVRAPPGPNAFVNPLYPPQVHSYDPDILGINVSARLWRLSVMNYLQTPVSDI